ncbi:alpha/beta hydrolase family domain-containing protein [Rhizoctonia solani AG-1 IA]|uniref:Alpha/beta hydrolase family domain-containing protein n=1 Tax=Thanatephorus cucumeris (strain AG1-IA) TaxID=983506 RepID=L8WJB7_THACA|nr:alpha/beta hydrolase family domain-containing protein [Rhizoctonia solani AG-1 IA]
MTSGSILGEVDRVCGGGLVSINAITSEFKFTRTTLMFDSIKFFAKTSASVAVGATTLGAVATEPGYSITAKTLLYIHQMYLRDLVPVNVATPADYGLPYSDLTFTTPDNVKIRAYLLVQRKILLSADGSLGTAEVDNQGDDADVSKRFLAAQPLLGRVRQFCFCMPMRGIWATACLWLRKMLPYTLCSYGLSEGQPSEKGLKLDAQPIKLHQILYGQSIGGAVAFYLANANAKSIAALIVENTFMTLPSLIPTVLPVAAPLAFLCHQVWDSASAARSLPKSVPVLMLSGTQDELVPPSQMRGLFDILRGAEDGPKEEETEEDKIVLQATDSKRLLVFKKFSNGHHSEYSWSLIDGRHHRRHNLSLHANHDLLEFITAWTTLIAGIIPEFSAWNVDPGNVAPSRGPERPLANWANGRSHMG